MLSDEQVMPGFDHFLLMKLSDKHAATVDIIIR